jgi:D-alanyl-D-alanine carboxypeptidase
MSPRLSLQLATPDDLADLMALRHAGFLSWTRRGFTAAQLRASNRAAPEPAFEDRLQNRTVLAARLPSRRLAALGAIEPRTGDLTDLVVADDLRGLGVGRRILAACERHAVQFGLLRLGVSAFEPAIGFFQACGYRSFEGARSEPDADTGLPSLYLRRHFPRRQTRYGERIRALHAELGIPRDYGRRRCLPLQKEARDLEDLGEDIYGRPQRLARAALPAWRAMRRAAAADGVELQVVSAYRDASYQAGIIERKLAAGQSMAEILRVSAAPGFSEHHTGRALDLTTPGAPVLEPEFERTRAFEWLRRQARRFDFHLSFPRDNRHGLAFEPWHWRHGSRGARL